MSEFEDRLAKKYPDRNLVPTAYAWDSLMCVEPFEMPGGRSRGIRIDIVRDWGAGLGGISIFLREEDAYALLQQVPQAIMACLDRQSDVQAPSTGPSTGAEQNEADGSVSRGQG